MDYISAPVLSKSTPANPKGEENHISATIERTVLNTHTCIDQRGKTVHDLPVEREVLFWQQQYNRLNNISQLPPELLGEVFAHVQEGYDPTIKALGWIQVTHVCSHWRRVALSQPSLWNTPNFHSPKLAKTIIARARSLPLFIQISLPHPLPPSLKLGIKLAFANLHRARELVVSLPEYQTHGQAVKRALHLQHHLRAPAPCLQDFLLYSVGDSTEKSCLPEDLFLGYAPRLQKVALLDWNLPWDSPSLGVYHNLRSLWIMCKGPHRTQMPQFPISVIIPALSQLPNLVELILKSPFLPLNAADLRWSEEGQVVELPKLKFVRLVECPTTCQLFLAYTSIPNEIRVILDKSQNPRIPFRTSTYSPSDGRVAAINLLHNLRWRIGGFRFSELEGGCDFWKVSEMESHGIGDSSRAPSYPTSHLRLHGFFHAWDLPILRQSGVLDEVRMVSVDHFLDATTGPRNIWREFGSLRALRELHVILDELCFLRELAPKIQNETIGIKINAIGFTGADAALNMTPQISFPALEVLGCRFEEAMFLEEFHWQETIHLLTCAIRSRRELGFGPRLVRLGIDHSYEVNNIVSLQAAVEVEFLR